MPVSISMSNSPLDTPALSTSRLQTSLGSLMLSTPIIASAGTLGNGNELADLVDYSTLGALTTPTITVTPRTGSPMPRTADVTAGLLHATGLPNPGLETFLEQNLPVLRMLPCPVIVSILGTSSEEWGLLARTLTEAGGPAAIELNLMPLALLDAEKSLSPDAYAASLYGGALREYIVEAIQAARAATDLPLIAKLPSVGIDIGEAAQLAVAAGADCINVTQAFPGIAVRLSGRSCRFPGVVAGLSGPAVKPLALYQTWRATQVVTVPVIGGGGIMSGEDALEFFVAGAAAVGVGIANMISPSSISRIAGEVAAYLSQHDIVTVRELRAR